METVKSFLESLGNVMDDQPEVKGMLTLGTLGVASLALMRGLYGLVFRKKAEAPITVKVDGAKVDVKIGGH